MIARYYCCSTFSNMASYILSLFTLFILRAIRLSNIRLTCERVREAVGNILAASLHATFFRLYVHVRKNGAKVRVRSKRLLSVSSFLLFFLFLLSLFLYLLIRFYTAHHFIRISICLIQILLFLLAFYKGYTIHFYQCPKY